MMSRFGFQRFREEPRARISLINCKLDPKPKLEVLILRTSNPKFKVQDLRNEPESEPEVQGRDVHRAT